MELELNDICLRLKKELGQRKDNSPTRIYQSKPKRGGSLSRPGESNEVLEKALTLKKSVKNYKEDLLKRDTLILDIIKNIDEDRKTSESSKKVNRELFSSVSDNNEDIAMKNKLKEFQKLNGSLLEELKNTHAKLMDARIQKEKILATTNSESSISKFSTQKERKESLETFAFYKDQPVNAKWNLEKIGMQTRINKLLSSLENSNEKIINMKTEHIKQLNSYFLKFTEIGNCLGNFLSMIDNLKMTSNDRKIQENFEKSKSKLMSLYQDIQSFEPKEANSKLITPMKSLYDKMDSELSEENYIEYTSSYSMQDSTSKLQTYENTNDSTTLKKYQRLIDRYKRSEEVLRDRINELNSTLKKQDEEIMNSRNHEVIMLNLANSIKGMETKFNATLTKIQ